MATELVEVRSKRPDLEVREEIIGAIRRNKSQFTKEETRQFGRTLGRRQLNLAIFTPALDRLFDNSLPQELIRIIVTLSTPTSRFNPAPTHHELIQHLSRRLNTIRPY